MKKTFTAMALTLVAGSMIACGGEAPTTGNANNVNAAKPPVTNAAPPVNNAAPMANTNAAAPANSNAPKNDNKAADTKTENKNK